MINCIIIEFGTIRRKVPLARIHKNKLEFFIICKIYIVKVSTDKAPAAIGPYSQAVKCGNMVFTSGQIAIDPAVGDIVAKDVQGQAEQVMKNLCEVLRAAGSSPELVIKTTCFLANIGDFAAFNEIYGKYFTEKPARSCVAAAALPKGALVEVEAVALLA